MNYNCSFSSQVSVLKKSWSLRTRSRTIVLKREFMVGWLPAESRTLTSWNEFSGMHYTSYFIDSDRLWSLQQAGPPSCPGVSKLSWTTAAHLPWLHRQGGWGAGASNTSRHIPDFPEIRAPDETQPINRLCITLIWPTLWLHTMGDGQFPHQTKYWLQWHVFSLEIGHV